MNGLIFEPRDLGWYEGKSFEKGGGRSSIAGMQVRPASRKDLPEILEIYNEAVLNTTASYDYEPRTLEHRTQWYEERAKARYPIFVAEDGKGQVAGWSALNPFHSRIGYQFTAENSVYVAAEQRGKGIGKLLMPPLIDGAKGARAGGQCANRPLRSGASTAALGTG